MAGIVNANPTGEDIIKGGIFFGSNLTPNGSFSNIPKFLTPEQKIAQGASVTLTLDKVKTALNNALKQQTGASADEQVIEKFLYEFVDLLVDYRDLRNYVFYGSANTELAYNIKYIIDNYPYNTLIGQKYGNNFIQIRNYIKDKKEYSEIIFPETYYYSPTQFERVILDDFNKFNFYDDNTSFNWGDYEVVDKNDIRYPVLNVVTPYKSPTVFNVSSMANISLVSPTNVTYNAIRITTASTHNYVAGQLISFAELNSTNGATVRYYTRIFNGSTYTNYYYDMNHEIFEIASVTSNTVIIKRGNGLPYEDVILDTPGLSPLYDTVNPGLIRLSPDKQNTRPFVIKMTVAGNISNNSFLDFALDGSSYKGFLISPVQKIINDWNFNLTSVQNMLLAPPPINPTPWPRRPVTNNIMNIVSGNDIEQSFYDWIFNPTTMYVEDVNDSGDIDQAYAFSIGYEYNLLRALSLDETYSNQIVRRAIPGDIINEIYDTDDHYFQRFLLIAGWLFDQVRLYSQFVKYSHTINTTDYNQLSPEYYKYYASYYGFDIFGDDAVDFSDLVVQTVPGQYYGIASNIISSNKYYQQTLQQYQYSRQKNLLLSIINLYKSKGVQACIYKLISLLGAPDGFLLLNEYAFAVDDRDAVGYPKNGYKGKRVIDNGKVNTPTVTFEIDTDYLVDKVNINSQVNKPYVYKQFYDNEYVHNLREISIFTDPNGAIDNQIVNIFGKQKYNYITFSKGEFSNLQRNEDFFLLPLSLPDRFYGLSLNYMIPRNGIRKGVGNNEEEAVCDVFSLYRISAAQVNQLFEIVNLTISTDYTTITITTSAANNYVLGEKVFITNVTGINKINNLMFQVQSVIDPFTFTIFGNFSGSWAGSGNVVSGKLNKFATNTGDITYSYPLATHYPDRNKYTDPNYALDSHANHVVDGYTNPQSDFDVLLQRYPNSTYVDDCYIISRLEGNDLVIRLKIQSEISGVYGERCAMMENVFEADGLNHSLRMVMRSEGVEVYKDYDYIGLARWVNISNAGPYKAIEIPKSELRTLIYSSDDCLNYYDPIDPSLFVADPNIHHTQADAINWWDLFIGMPTNVDFYFSKLNFFDNVVINDYDIADKIVNNKGYTSEFYVFEVANPTKNSLLFEELQDFTVPAVFYEAFPNNIPIYYAYALPQIQDQYNRPIVDGLELSNHRCYNEIYPSLLLNHIQDFFEFKEIFENNAWMENIHKSYDYDLFNGLVQKLYALYSSQVLTYTGLQKFMDLIENKFRDTFEQFIPIVINISEFGRLIKNSEFFQPKMRIPGSDKVCVMQRNGSRALTTTKVFRNDMTTNDGAIENINLGYSLVTNIGTVIVPYTAVPWNSTRLQTLLDLKHLINSLSIAVNNQIHADVYSNELRISVDYEWFLLTYGESPNNLILVINQQPNTWDHKFYNGFPKVTSLHPAVVDNCGRVITSAYSDEDTCGSITYTLPEHKDKPVYIYFETEHKPETFVYFENETIAKPTWTRFSTE